MTTAPNGELRRQDFHLQVQQLVSLRALLLGKSLRPQAFTDDTVGRVLDRLYDFGTMRLFPDCAVRAVTRFDLERRYVHFDTTSRSVWGDYQFAETQDLPFQVTYG